MGRMWKENKLSGSDAVAGDMIGHVDDGSNVLGNCLFFSSPLPLYPSPYIPFRCFSIGIL